jgi:hypothetical protein
LLHRNFIDFQLWIPVGTSRHTSFPWFSPWFFPANVWPPQW